MKAAYLEGRCQHCGVLIRSGKGYWDGEIAANAQVHDLVGISRDAVILLNGTRPRGNALGGVDSSTGVAIFLVPDQILWTSVLCEKISSR